MRDAADIVAGQIVGMVSARREGVVSMNWKTLQDGAIDLAILNLGAGVQSTTLALLAAAGEVQPMPAAAIFADTRWEPESVYANVEWLKVQLPFPLMVVSNGRSLRDDVVEGVSADGHPFVTIPVRILNPNGSRGLSQRQCTMDYKIRPIHRTIREMLGYGPGEIVKRSTRVEQWFGISTDEVLRVKDSRHRWIANRYPLVELGMSRRDCLQWFKAHFPDRELSRSACVGCPFRSDEEWLRVAESDPDALEDAFRVDEILRSDAHSGITTGTPYIYRKYKPLREAVSELKHLKEISPPLFGDEFLNECEGHCGL